MIKISKAETSPFGASERDTLRMQMNAYLNLGTMKRLSGLNLLKSNMCRKEEIIQSIST
jgi:hypothetical protein